MFMWDVHEHVGDGTTTAAVIMQALLARWDSFLRCRLERDADATRELSAGLSNPLPP